ncbi:hypothetical protein K9L05_00245 [Candidatus Babeliales bacterium]|nr:hypothetical protein [Candidatus Babeliales bacterium]MCF7899066.1 hypothetical protein [Candidatus Babeliales bacterium]
MLRFILKNKTFILFLMFFVNFSHTYSMTTPENIEKLGQDTNNILIALKQNTPKLFEEIIKQSSSKSSLSDLKANLQFAGKISSLYDLKSSDLIKELICLQKESNKKVIAPLIVTISSDYLIKNLENQKLIINKMDLESNKKLDFYLNLAKKEAMNIENMYFQKLNTSEIQLFNKLKSGKVFTCIQNKTTNNILKQLVCDKSQLNQIPNSFKDLLNKSLELLEI